jgi:hypothetical protein
VLVTISDLSIEYVRRTCNDSFLATLMGQSAAPKGLQLEVFA